MNCQERTNKEAGHPCPLFQKVMGDLVVAIGRYSMRALGFAGSITVINELRTVLAPFY